jgi:hypothetical protein
MDKRIVAANQLAGQYGIKTVITGPPGSGKTPLMGTMPRGITLAVEPGYRSVRNQNFPCWNGINDLKSCDDWFDWVFGSNEAKAFDSVGVDSLSQYCELVLNKYKAKNAHGLKAFGEMAEHVYGKIERLFYLREKHVVLNCKQETVYMPGPGPDPIQFSRPYFPGKALIVQIPHLFDEFWSLDEFIVPGVNGKVSALLTKKRSDRMVRSRSGNLNEYEPPNLTDIFAKAM